ncbi:MAG TPA: DUF1043 family protein [Candidatus Limnocylindrales bacterium]|nr:DUF1043 family protein [Candidatus Limnocylindrales bacterium]
MAISVQLIVALVVGVGIGLVAGYLTFPAIREAKRLRIQLDGILAEHETYKKSVSAHFRKTGELVGEMTRSYAAVYDHLATGARSFAAEAASEMTLPFGPSPGMLASPVIETASEPSSPGASMEPSPAPSMDPSPAAAMKAPSAAAMDSSPDSPAMESTDAALDGSMLAAEVFVGTEGALDSSSDTTTSADGSADAESRKA